MEEKDKKCNFKTLDGTSCGRELYDDERCIFHSLKRDKDVKLFQSKLNEIFEDKAIEMYNFSGFIFPGEIVFPKVINKQIICKNSTFQGFISFAGRIFYKSVDFEGSKFLDKTFFINVIFNDYALFSNAVFDFIISFSGSVFKSDAFFSNAIYKNFAWYIGTIFKKTSDFSNVTFNNKGLFSFTTFEDKLIIDEEENNKIFSFKEEEIDFSYVRFFRPEKVSFRKVNLSKFRFLETDLRKVEFVDVEWYQKKSKGRNMIYDEIIPEPSSGEFDFPLISQVYKRLRANYEENLNYAEAGDFHIGEMEMRRRHKKEKISNRIAICIYKGISYYGESFLLPLGWILLFLFILFPLSYMLVGIIPRIEGSQIQYYLDFSLKGIIPTFEKIKDYWSSFVYSSSVFSLIRERPYQTINDLGHFFTILESIFSPVLIAFFLLALRRKFKR